MTDHHSPGGTLRVSHTFLASGFLAFALAAVLHGQQPDPTAPGVPAAQRIAACRKAVDEKPDDPDAHCNLGSALFDSGDLKGAAAAYRQAIKEDPRHTDAYIYLGVTLAEDKDQEGAFDAWDKVIEVAPEDAKVPYNLGVALESCGYRRKAIAAYRKAIALNPDYARAHNNLGAALQREGDLDEAIGCYRNALATDPEHRNAKANLARALKARDGRVEEGKKPEVGRVDIEGNLSIADHIIRREVKLRPGSVFDAALLAQSRDALMKTGLFEKVLVSHTPSHMPGYTNIHILVMEKKQR